jgi:type II secretion system protein H
MASLAPPMTSRTHRSTIGSPTAHSARGFTLIELILVMVIMAVGAALVAPSLSTFFRGRVLDQEAHRMLALTQYARSRAVAEGMPVELWIDQANGLYGINIVTGFTAFDDRSVSYEADPSIDFSFEFLEDEYIYEETDPVETMADTAVVFQPDGLIQPGSVANIHLTLAANQSSLTLALDRLGTGYEILALDELALP